MPQLTLPYAQSVAGWYKYQTLCKLPIFPGNTSTHLGHEVIKPRCLNTSKGRLQKKINYFPREGGGGRGVPLHGKFHDILSLPLLVFRHLGLITSCPRWVLVFPGKMGSLHKSQFVLCMKCQLW